MQGDLFFFFANVKRLTIAPPQIIPKMPQFRKTARDNYRLYYQVKKRPPLQAAFLQFSLNLCSYPQYITWGGGGKRFLRKISYFRLLFRQRFGGYEVGAFRAGRHAIGKRLIALFKQTKVLVKNFSHGAPPKIFSGGSAARRLRLNLTSRHPHVLVKGAVLGACLPLTSARGCATPGCTNFLTGAFPARGEKAVYGPRAASGGGPAPAKASAPRARGAGRARGARTIGTNPGPEKQQGQHRAPGKHRPRSRAANFGGLAPGRGARRPPSGRPFNAAPSSNGGSGGRPCGATLPERRGSRATGPGARGASRENEQLQASGERARRPGGEGAAAAALPGLCRAWLFRGELLLHPLRGGLAAGCSCAAAHPPAGYSWVVRSSAWEMMLHAASQPCT